jgi:lysophospholipase L1-like esterase
MRTAGRLRPPRHRGTQGRGVDAEAVPAGISGHKSDQMLARLEKDVLSKKPRWMTLNCGVNHVWHGAEGVQEAALIPDYASHSRDPG